MATRFENWRGTSEAGKKETDEYVEVRTSEASKRDARPVVPKNTETVDEEFDRLIREKSEIEAQLSGYSKAAMLKEQSQIRRQFHGPASLEQWINRKHQLEQERSKLIKKKQVIESRLGFIKVAAKRKKAEKGTFVLWQEPMLELLAEIRDELRSIRKDWGSK